MAVTSFFRDVEMAHVVCAVLNSNLFYSYFIAHGDCFHLSDTLATSFPLWPPVVGDKSLVKLDDKPDGGSEEARTKENNRD